MKGLADIFGGGRGYSEEEEEFPEELLCLSCGTDLSESDLYRRYRVCDNCRFHFSLAARERIDLLADPGSFKEVNRSVASVDPLSFSGKSPYKLRIAEAQKRTGLSDAVITGTCTIDGKPAILAVLDFGFLGGSMGCVVGEKIARAFELAIKKRLPVITVVTSGGARVQEGVLSLMQMAKTAAAVKRHHAARLPYISVLANPTTGEVYASFANLGDIIVSEPGAIIGFAPLKVVEKAAGKPLPEGAHTAESHLSHGMIDQIVDRTKLRELLSALLELTNPRYKLTMVRKPELHRSYEQRPESAWRAVQLARHQMRPTALDYIGRITSNFVELHGDRLYGDDPAIICGLADISGEAVVIIGQEKGHGDTEQLRRRGQAYPEGYRKALRAMNLAAKLGLPLLTLIDTPGAHPGLEAEERGLGGAIASCLANLSDLPTPVVSVVIGEGGSEGALALGVADRTLMLEHAIYSIISPEGAAAILYRDATKAQEVAPSLKLTAHDCKLLGVIDHVVQEPEGGAHADPDDAARLVKQAILQQLLGIQSISLSKLLKARYEKFRHMGQYTSYFNAAIARELVQLQDHIQHRLEDLREYLPHRTKRAPEVNKTG